MIQELINKLWLICDEIRTSGQRINFKILAEQLSDQGVSISKADLPEFISALVKKMGADAGLFYVPETLTHIIAKILEGRSSNIVCDPWAGLGSLLSSVMEATQAPRSIAYSPKNDQTSLGEVLLPSAEWWSGEISHFLTTLPNGIDIVASMIPFGFRNNLSIILNTSAGSSIEIQSDLGGLILAASSVKLSSEGIGLFVVPNSFFFSNRSILRKFETLGLGIFAALAMPPGSFAPYVTIPTHLIIIKKEVQSQTFVAQLSQDQNTNNQIIDNYKQRIIGTTLELGCYVDTMSFSGVESLQLVRRINQLEQALDYPAVPLGEIANQIILGVSNKDFAFPNIENSIFIPLLGNSDVVDSWENASLKAQNYAQVVINSTCTYPQFVYRFLNSELGRMLRSIAMTGTTILRMNLQSIRGIRIYIPDLETQQSILATEASITSELNIILGLQNELVEYRRNLWADPRSQDRINQGLRFLSSRISGNMKNHTDESLELWFETLPFPLASILRAWQATESEDYKTKYEHLLDFFEATTEFLSIIFLSAFYSKEQVFEGIKRDLEQILKKQNLGFKRATFGTWRAVLDFLLKQIRIYLSSNDDNRSICIDMFAGVNTQLPEVLSHKNISGIIEFANNKRNVWRGHGGVVSQEEAKLRNEQLLSRVQELREVMGNIWKNVQLVSASNCRPRRGMFENNVAILMGSNSEFIKEWRGFSTGLDVERLYIVHRDSLRVLQLLPLIIIGSSPTSAKNACYFFNRVEKEGLRYISYHYTDLPERFWSIKDAQEASSLLDL
ncbi:MAG: N-6 DNA methylase [Anaerolineales bacterium]|nr:N-6 DNA methylase [Anaerolineales bacterium]